MILYLYLQKDGGVYEVIASSATEVEMQAKLISIKAQIFSDLMLSGYEYRRSFMNYLVVATELPDGTGKVYFLTPEQANAHKLTITDEVVTDHRVVSIDYQRSNILEY